MREESDGRDRMLEGGREVRELCCGSEIVRQREGERV